MKNQILSEENERLKNVKICNLIWKEISNLQNKILLKENIYNDSLCHISNYENERQELIMKVQTLSKNYELSNSLLRLAEKEKAKHLEQSAIVINLLYLGERRAE